MACLTVMASLSSCSGRDGKTSGNETSASTETTVSESTDYTSVVKLTAQEALEQGVIKVNGRYELLDGGAISCDWAGGGIEFNADTKGKVIVNISCDDTLQSSGGAVSYFSVWVDGERKDSFTRYTDGNVNVIDGVQVKGRKQSVTLAEGLEAGVHSFKLAKQGNPRTGLAQINYITFKGKFVEKPADSGFLIEFIGDSLTAAQGVLGSPTYGDYSVKYEDGTLGYAYLAAEQLNADCMLVARPGIGLVCGSEKDNSVQMSKIYHLQCFWRSLTKEYAPVRKPDLIVYNLGTNDNSQGVDPNEYRDVLNAFIKEVRGYYGEDVPVFIIVNNDIKGNLLSYTEDAVKGFDNIKISDYVRHRNGYANHPNREDAVIESKKLVNQIKSLYPDLCKKGNK